MRLKKSELKLAVKTILVKNGCFVVNPLEKMKILILDCEIMRFAFVGAWPRRKVSN
jgi:hypothetical protein